MEMPDAVVCDGGPGVLGDFLQCTGGVWTKIEPPCDIGVACPDELGFSFPKMAGCLGDGAQWTCACGDYNNMMPQECPQDGVSKCGEMLFESVKVELCVEDAGKLYHYVGLCPKCSEAVAGQPLCEF
jgi:hypothetical protein